MQGEAGEGLLLTKCSTSHWLLGINVSVPSANVCPEKWHSVKNKYTVIYRTTNWQEQTNYPKFNDSQIHWIVHFRLSVECLTIVLSFVFLGQKFANSQTTHLLNKQSW